MTSPSEIKVGDRVRTPIGVGTVRNLARRGGEVTAVIFFPDSSVEKNLPDSDRYWRAADAEKVEVIDE